jgi:hypothetical protein
MPTCSNIPVLFWKFQRLLLQRSEWDNAMTEKLLLIQLCDHFFLFFFTTEYSIVSTLHSILCDMKMMKKSNILNIATCTAHGNWTCEENLELFFTITDMCTTNWQYLLR